MFFKSSPNLPDHEKARVEYHLQQLTECVGHELMLKPIVIPDETFGRHANETNLSLILKAIGDHLGHDIDAIQVLVQPKALEVCGGGG
jgi:hypothetical protein